MKNNHKFNLLLWILIFALSTPICAKEILYCYGNNKVVKIAPEGMSVVSVLLSDVPNICAFDVNTNGMYLANGEVVKQYSISNGSNYGTLLNTSSNGSWNSMTAGSDGNVYVKNQTSNSLSKYDSNLINEANLVNGIGGQGISAGPMGIYSISDSYILRYPYAGGFSVDNSYNHGPCQVVKVGPDGYVYARFGTITLKMAPWDLKIYTVLHATSGDTQLKDTAGVPLTNNLTDIAVSIDGKYFYAADGTYIWEFDINGGNAIARSDANGYTLLDIYDAETIEVTEDLLAYGNDKVVQVNPKTMKPFSVFLENITNVTDMDSDSSGIYLADGAVVKKYSYPGEMPLVNTSSNGSWHSITIGTDAKIYVKNDTTLNRYDSNLANEVNLFYGIGGRGISAGEYGIYSLSGYTVLRYPYSGIGYNDDCSVPVCPSRAIKVGPDGYVYVRFEGVTFKYNPQNLLDYGGEYLHHYATSATQLCDFYYGPIVNITDIAISPDANYFYAADGTYIWKFNISGGNAIARSNAAGYTLVNILEVQSPEPKTYLLGYCRDKVIMIDPDDVDREMAIVSMLLSDVPNICAFDVNTNGMYLANGEVIKQYRSPNGSNYGTLLNTSSNGSWNSMTVGSDGNVYVKNQTSNSLSKYDSNLINEANLVNGIGGQGISAGPMGIYSISDSYILRYPYAGGFSVDNSYSHGPCQVVKVGPDGYVYARFGTITLKMTPGNLKAYTILHAASGDTQLKDTAGIPLANNLTDIAVSIDGKYFYAADGTYIWKFDINGGNAIACSNAGNYTKIELLAMPKVELADDFTDITAVAVKTVYQTGGVPHTDRHGISRTQYVPGTSYLPKGLYHGVHYDDLAKTIESNWPLFKLAGFNTVWLQNPQDDLPYLQILATNNFQVVATSAYGNLADAIVNAGYSDLVIGWNIFDEPELYDPALLTPEELEGHCLSMISEVTTVDPVPGRAYFTNGIGGSTTRWYDLSLLNSFDIYPYRLMTQHNENDPQTIVDISNSVEAAVNAVDPQTLLHKPVWVIFQAFWEYLWYRPSGDDLRSMVYTAIVNGATGFNFFMYDCEIGRRYGGGDGIFGMSPKPANYPSGIQADSDDLDKMVDLWNATAKINLELVDLEPWIFSPTSSNDQYRVSVSGVYNRDENIIYCMLKEYNNQSRFIVVSVQRYPVKVKFNFLADNLGLSKANVLYRNTKVIPISAVTQEFEDSFGPMEVKVYELE